MTATRQIEQALLNAGYHEVTQLDVTQRSSKRITDFGVYVKNDQTVLLERHTDGGCEVYAPVTKSLSIRETIDAIMELTKCMQ